MVKGLELFKEHFASYSKSYTLIGGIACMLSMEQAGLSFRATKDLDIVLCIEALEKQFVEDFWNFIKKANYQIRQRSSGKKIFYRFCNPTKSFYPEILELFSRKPDLICLKDNSHLTPIPVNEEVSSLSAILLNDDYYKFIQEGKLTIDKLPIIGPTHLIPLKARAFLDLLAQSESGVHVDKKDIRKHRNDIFRLYQLLSINSHIHLPESIYQDMKIFFTLIKNDSSIDLKALGLKNIKFDEMLSTLNSIYGLLSE
ncbi:MAG: hypothetical protein KR126chlam5_01113 [Candidatus Anoxychlamydiales bacterium]|nr:hypothetical protein [Candidatus Anoxychlamydiales bacterium]